MLVSQSLFALPRMIFAVVVIAVLAFGSSVQAVSWFDDFSDGNADDPPVQWTPSPVFAGSYDASSGSYVLTPTDDGSQPAGTGDENLLSTVNSFSFTNTSIRTQAVVGFSTEPDPDRDADSISTEAIG